MKPEFSFHRHDWHDVARADGMLMVVVVVVVRLHARYGQKGKGAEVSKMMPG